MLSVLRSWDVRDTESLCRLIQDGEEPDKIADKLGRSIASVLTRADKLKYAIAHFHLRLTAKFGRIRPPAWPAANDLLEAVRVKRKAASESSKTSAEKWSQPSS